jgi:hypothetical protein
MKKGAGLDSGPFTLEGSVSWLDCIAVSEALVNPRFHLSHQPGDPVSAQPDPFGELAGMLQSLDVLRRIRDATDCLQLLLRYDLF